MKSIGIQVSEEIYALLMEEAHFQERSIASQIRIILKERYRDRLAPYISDEDAKPES